MTCWWKRKDARKISAQAEKRWYPAFHKVHNADYGSLWGHMSFDSWNRISTSYEYVILDHGVKHYECSPDGGVHIQFYPEHDLQFPARVTPVEAE